MTNIRLTIEVQLLQEVSDTFPQLKDFINEKLEQKCAQQHISIGEVIYYLFDAALLLHLF